MDTAAKVGIGVALTVGAVAGIAALAAAGKRSTLLGRARGASGLTSTTAATPIEETTSANGVKVKVYQKGKLPIRERLAILQGHVAKGVRGEDLPAMRALALKITRGCPARDDVCETKAIYNWVRKNIRYTGDIATHKLENGQEESVDLFQTAKNTADFGGGDCDDHAVLVSTLAILNGIQTRLRVTSQSRWSENAYSHIYPVVGLPKNDPRRWVAVDTTLPGDRYGVEMPYVKNLDVLA